jgi:hypothetical protein
MDETNPGIKLIKSIDKDLFYSIKEICFKCQDSGIYFSHYKLQKDIERGKLKSIQFGGRGSDHHIRGGDFLETFISSPKDN